MPLPIMLSAVEVAAVVVMVGKGLVEVVTWGLGISLLGRSRGMKVGVLMHLNALEVSQAGE